MNEAVCRTCSRVWPQTTFKKFAALAGSDDPLCDSCWDRSIVDTREGQIAGKIEEAQTDQPKTALRREVHVVGIESGTNVVEFRYITHLGNQAVKFTTLRVLFRGGSEYFYPDVPVPVAEAWYAAPSKGGYFQQFIRNAYECEKVK